MRPNRALTVFALCFALVLPNLYGADDCQMQTLDYPTITSPLPNATIPTSGIFTASVTFPSALLAASFVQMQLQTNGGATMLDVTSLFLPPGQSDFAGATSASAELDATALGLIPGGQTFIVSLDVDGAGGAAARLVTFSWTGSTSCQDAIGPALEQCFLDVSDATRLCYLGTGAACSPQAAELVAAESALQAAVTGACDDGTVQSLGYGSALTANALADRLLEECKGNASTLAARVFGGPHAKVLAGVLGGQVPLGETCLDAVYAESAAFLDVALGLQSDCIATPASCVPSTLAADIDTAEAQSSAAIGAACPGGFLEFLIGLTPDDTLARTRLQSECMVGAAFGDASPLSLRCGPGSLPGVTILQTSPPGLTPLAPGVPTQLMLDESVWGTRCGDGGPYAFWVQVAPAGNPAGNVVSHMQGGGVCVLESQCVGVANGNPGLFDSIGDGFSSSGIFNADPAQSAFADWTKIFLPYCTQDVFVGGGVSEAFTGGLTVERYGAVNARAALTVLRNIVADELNATTTEGYRPDLMRVVFSGSSAGGFGVIFNMHFVLDDLRWARTTTISDAALGLDTGAPTGIGTLGSLAQLSWATRLTQPPYCLDTNCAVGPILAAAHSERLLATPEQRFLFLSNQVDNTQRNTTGWPSTAAFVNAVRTSYCDNQGLPGVRYFLDGIPSSFHTYLPSNTAYLTYGIGSVTVADWVEQSVFDPANLANTAEESTITTAFPGVLPFGCPVD